MRDWPLSLEELQLRHACGRGMHCPLRHRHGSSSLQHPRGVWPCIRTLRLRTLAPTLGFCAKDRALGSCQSVGMFCSLVILGSRHWRGGGGLLRRVYWVLVLALAFKAALVAADKNMAAHGAIRALSGRNEHAFDGTFNFGHGLVFLWRGGG